MGKKAKKKARTPTKEKRVPSRFQKDVTEESTDPSNETSSDKTSRQCPHLDKGLDLASLSEKLNSLETIRCEHCREGAADRKGSKGKGKHGKKKGSSSIDSKLESRAIWICLDCGHYGCGGIGFPTIPQSHAVRHARLTRHQLAVQLENPNLRWCFPCSGPVKAEDNGVEGKDFFGEVVKLIKGRSVVKSSKGDVEDVWFGGGSVTGEVIQKAEGSADGVDRVRSGGHVVRGLINLGNTCFFNSVMQNLLAMDKLRDHFFLSEISSLGPVAISFKKLLSEINGEEGKRNVISPKTLFGSICAKAPQFRGYQQHDSHELLRCLLDLLSIEESDMRKKENSNKRLTFVDSVFGGQISSTVCCTECGYTSTVYEPFLDLSLPVPTKKPVAPKKSSQLASRGKKAKVMPKRGGRPWAKVSRDVSSSTSANNPQPPSECPEASVSSSLGDDQNVKDDENGGSGPPLELPAEKEEAAPTADSFAWLDYLDSADPSSGEVNMDTQDTMHILDEKGDVDNHDSTWMDFLCPESVSDDRGLDSVKNNNNDIKFNDQVTGDGGTKEMSHSREDEEPLLMVQDSEVLLLPYYAEEETQASVVTSGGGQDESAEFDGFGDLFAEPEIESGNTGDSSLGGVGSGFVAGNNSSDSDPGEVDDSDSPVSVESCLTHFTKSELLSKDNAWHCEKCSKALQLQNKTKKRANKEKTRNNGDENGSVISEIISNEISCNGSLDESGNDSTKSDDSQRSKGASEDETSKPVSDVFEDDQEEENPAPSLKVKRDATKRVLIYKAPPILTIHLKRFNQDARGRLSKLSGHVIFREMIDLRPYIDSRGKGEEKLVYRLVGVVEHLGTMRGGHYVAYIRGSGSSWFHASDAYIQEVSLDEVLKCDAYILFYELI